MNLTRNMYKIMTSIPAVRPPSLLANGYWGMFLQGLKRYRHEADNSPPSNAEIKNDEAIPPLPHTPSWRGA
jgi:hypothetical protein